MTDMVKGFTVTLDQDIRIDDIETVMRAIGMIKHVVHVEPSITDSSDIINRQMVRDEFRNKFYKFIKEEI